ncbi:hypothetical protein [Pseudophaeobacter arcticus]|uniref:hypothetical protein n=1 Tax=Pseudophaeobacter arcticus TaxID=385492 RepID=UPI003A984F6B
MEKQTTGATLKTGTITDPRYSKLLDVHRYSEHSAVSHLVKPIWHTCFGQPENADSRRGGVKPKASGLTQLRTIILDLYMAWATDPDLSVAVTMDNTVWKTGSRYNKIGMSRQSPRVISRLHELEYIDLAAGSYAGPGAATNRTTRIRAAEPLRRLFRNAKFGPQHVLSHPEKENIIMRGAETSQRNMEYSDTPDP